MDYSFIEKTDSGNAAPAKIKPMANFADPFDLDRAKQDFAVFESKIKDWAKAVSAADLKTEKDAADFTDTIGKAKSLIKNFEVTRKQITENAYNFYKDVMGFEKFYSNMIEKEVIRPAESKLSFYFKQIEIERQKAEKAAQAAAAAKQNELDKIADEAGVNRVELDKPILKQDKAKIAGEAATAHSKEYWNYRITKMETVPRQFLMINEKAIRQAIKNGERNIPGLEIFKEVKAQVRARR